MTDSTAQEFSQSDIRVSLRTFSGCRKEAEVVVGKELLAEAHREAVKAVRKEVSLPGFRKGKAPDAVVLKKFPTQIDSEEKQKLADLAFRKMREIAPLELLSSGSISFNLKGKSPEEATLLFTFETEPEVPMPNLSLFQSDLPPLAAPTEEQIEEAMYQMRFYYANWENVTDRPVEENDYLTLDLETEENGAFKKVFDKVRFEVSKKRMADWMKKAVLHAKAGDVVDAVSEADADAPQEEKETFQPKKVRLTIHAIEKAVLPEMDDAFAQKVGAQDVAALRKNIASLLQGQLAEQRERALRDQVNAFLISQSNFEVPHSQFEAEKKHRIQQAMQNPRFRSEWSKMSREDQEKWEQKTAQEAKEALFLFYIARQIVRTENLPITQKQLQDEIVKVLQESGARDAQAFAEPAPEVRALALSRVVLHKAQDFVLSLQKA